MEKRGKEREDWSRRGVCFVGVEYGLPRGLPERDIQQSQ